MRISSLIALLAAGLAGAWVVRPPCVRAASVQSPVERTRELYASYGSDHRAPLGLDILTAKLRQHWFSPRLVRLLQNDARCGELRDLDYDPLVDGPEPSVSKVEVSRDDTAGGRQGVTVRFENAGRPNTVSLTWVKTGDGWRIDEIEMNDGKRISAVLSEPCEPFAPDGR